jgi:transcriptional regulator with XRE-family HTH domain
MTFPLDRLAALREERGLTRPELAERLGVSIRTVQRWEAGDSKPFPRDVRALLNLFPAAGTNGSKKRGR